MIKLRILVKGNKIGQKIEIDNLSVKEAALTIYTLEKIKGEFLKLTLDKKVKKK